jgi:hypothetical protein
MNILILNWPSGENDPFSLFNAHLQRKLQDYGCQVDIITLDQTFGTELPKFIRKRVDLALTWQGLGSGASLGDSGQNLWEKLEIPLVSLHGDHPSHMPDNHIVDNRFVKHVYTTPSFCRYSNKYFARLYPALFWIVPSFFSAHEGHCREGDYFVLPKNLDNTAAIINGWKNSLPSKVSEFLVDAAYAIIDEYKAGDRIDHHQIIDSLLTDSLFAEIKTALATTDAVPLFHRLHGTLDKIYRNAVSELVIKELWDFPLVVNGRGWDEFNKNQSPRHIYNSVGTASNGDRQFYSTYGIIDVMPCRDSMHDRTFRAISHGGGFLSNCQAEYLDDLGHEFGALFYTGKPGELAELAESVVRNPEHHRELCVEFGRAFVAQWSFYSFYMSLSFMAKH